MTKRIFMVYENLFQFRELSEEEANSTSVNPEDDGTPTEVEVIDGVTHIKCLCYWSSSGVFEMRITRPVEQALWIYMATLGQDAAIG